MTRCVVARERSPNGEAEVVAGATVVAEGMAGQDKARDALLKHQALLYLLAHQL